MPGPGRLDRHADLGRREVGRDGDSRASPRTRSRSCGSAGCSWGSARPGRLGRWPRTGTCWRRRRRGRAADVVGRRHQHVVDAVEVGLDGVHEPVVEVVDADRRERARRPSRRTSSSAGRSEKLMSSTSRPRIRVGSGTSVKTLNIGTIDLPLLSSPAWCRSAASACPRRASRRCRGTSRCRPGRGRHGRPRRRHRCCRRRRRLGVVVGRPSSGDVDGVQRAGAGRRRHLGDDLVAVARC